MKRLIISHKGKTPRYRTAYSLDELNITENYLKNKWNISY